MPRYSYNRDAHLGIGTVEFSLEVEAGRISKCRIYGDFFGKGAIQDIEEALLGILVTKQDKDNIRVTTLYPGAVESELKYGSSDPEASENIQAFYKAYEIPASSVARAIAYAIGEPEEVAINEITLRSTRQEF